MGGAAGHRGPLTTVAWQWGQPREQPVLRGYWGQLTEMPHSLPLTALVRLALAAENSTVGELDLVPWYIVSVKRVAGWYPLGFHRTLMPCYRGYQSLTTYMVSRANHEPSGSSPPLCEVGMMVSLTLITRCECVDLLSAASSGPHPRLWLPLRQEPTWTRAPGALLLWLLLQQEEPVLTAAIPSCWSGGPDPMLAVLCGERQVEAHIPKSKY